MRYLNLYSRYIHNCTSMCVCVCVCRRHFRLFLRSFASCFFCNKIYACSCVLSLLLERMCIHIFLFLKCKACAKFNSFSKNEEKYVKIITKMRDKMLQCILWPLQRSETAPACLCICFGPGLTPLWEDDAIGERIARKASHHTLLVPVFTSAVFSLGIGHTHICTRIYKNRL